MLSLVIPCFNAESSIDGHIEKLLAFLSAKRIPFEVILVDDGSEDATAKKLGEWVRRDDRIKTIIFPKNRGKGAAVKAGILGSKGDIVLFTDADLPYDLHAIDTFTNAIEQGADVVLGTRFKAATVEIPAQRGHRTVLSRLFLCIANRILITPVPDTQAGFKGFRGEVARKLFEEISIAGFGFDVELILRAQQKGYRVISLPVELVQQGVSNVRVLRDGFRMCLDLVHVAVERSELVTWTTFKQFFMYGAVGVLNTLLSFAIVNALIFMTGVTKGFGLLLISLCAFSLVVLHSFIWNRAVVFKKEKNENLGQEYSLFFVVTTCTLLLNLLVIHLIVNVIGAPYHISEQVWANFALFITIPLSVVCNFLGYKYIVFSKSNS